MLDLCGSAYEKHLYVRLCVAAFIPDFYRRQLVLSVRKLNRTEDLTSVFCSELVPVQLLSRMHAHTRAHITKLIFFLPTSTATQAHIVKVDSQSLRWLLPGKRWASCLPACPPTTSFRETFHRIVGSVRRHLFVPYVYLYH
jgi:hypothetical protein